MNIFIFLERNSFRSLFLFDRTGVTEAVNLAQADINANSSILSDIDIVVVRNNDGCHLDAVMRTFINYYVRPDGVLGVLGPPCSETVEPVAGTHFTHTHTHTNLHKNCLLCNLRFTLWIFCNSFALFISFKFKNTLVQWRNYLFIDVLRFCI